MTREEAILWMRVLKHSKINWVGEKAEEEDIIKRCEEAEQEAIDMAIEALSEVRCNDCKWNDDVIEVVRCKDCRHGEHIQIPLWENRDIDKAPSQFHDFIKCHKFHIKGFNETLYLGDDDYCSYGERREE